MARNNNDNGIGIIVLGGLFLFILLPIILFFLFKVLILIGIMTLILIIIQRFIHEEFVEEHILWFILIGSLFLGLLSLSGGTVLQNYINNNQFLSNLKELIPKN